MTIAAPALPFAEPQPFAAAGIAFEVAGEPQPQGSAKAFKHRHTGRVMVTSDNARLRPWRDAVCWNARQALAGRGPLVGPVAVTLVFRFGRPCGHFGKRGLRPSAPKEHVVRPDLDKLVRAVLDALSEAGVWRDDNQVGQLHACKGYGGLAGLQVEVVRVNGQVGVPDVQEAG